MNFGRFNQVQKIVLKKDYLWTPASLHASLDRHRIHKPLYPIICACVVFLNKSTQKKSEDISGVAPFKGIKRILKAIESIDRIKSQKSGYDSFQTLYWNIASLLIEGSNYNIQVFDALISFLKKEEDKIFLWQQFQLKYFKVSDSVSGKLSLTLPATYFNSLSHFWDEILLNHLNSFSLFFYSPNYTQRFICHFNAEGSEALSFKASPLITPQVWAVIESLCKEDIVYSKLYKREDFFINTVSYEGLVLGGQRSIKESISYLAKEECKDLFKFLSSQTVDFRTRKNILPSSFKDLDKAIEDCSSSENLKQVLLWCLIYTEGTPDWEFKVLSHLSKLELTKEEIIWTKNRLLNFINTGSAKIFLHLIDYGIHHKQSQGVYLYLTGEKLKEHVCLHYPKTAPISWVVDRLESFKNLAHIQRKGGPYKTAYESIRTRAINSRGKVKLHGIFSKRGSL